MDKSAFETLVAILNSKAGDEFVCEIVNRVIEAVGAKNIVQGIPDDWSVDSSICDIDTLKGFAFAYLWDQLVSAEANDVGWDAGTENRNLRMYIVDPTKPVDEVNEERGDVVVRIWDDWGDGDATAEGVLQNLGVAEDHPEYAGRVTDLNGKSTWVTIN